jgi:hypothetical protein
LNFFEKLNAHRSGHYILQNAHPLQRKNLEQEGLQIHYKNPLVGLGTNKLFQYSHNQIMQQGGIMLILQPIAGDTKPFQLSN